MPRTAAARLSCSGAHAGIHVSDGFDLVGREALRALGRVRRTAVRHQHPCDPRRRRGSSAPDSWRPGHPARPGSGNTDRRHGAAAVNGGVLAFWSSRAIPTRATSCRRPRRARDPGLQMPQGCPGTPAGGRQSYRRRDRRHPHLDHGMRARQLIVAAASRARARRAAARHAPSPTSWCAPGAKCSDCHTNLDGRRQAHAVRPHPRARHPARPRPPAHLPKGVEGFNGEINQWVSIGADLRVRNTTLFAGSGRRGARAREPRLPEHFASERPRGQGVPRLPRRSTSGPTC